MARGKFVFGFLMGAIAGVAAKIIYDNKDEVTEILKQKAEDAREGITNFVDYASDRISDFGEEVGKKATEYSEYAKEQLQELKETLNDETYTFPNEQDETSSEE
ncbi:MAG: YtxH domain-containing protein [Anaerofustis sp.]